MTPYDTYIQPQIRRTEGVRDRLFTIGYKSIWRNISYAHPHFINKFKFESFTYKVSKSNCVAYRRCT